MGYVAGAMIGYDRTTTIDALGSVVGAGDFGLRSGSDLAHLVALRAGVGVGVCQIPLAERDPDLRRILPSFAHGLEVWLVGQPSQRGTVRIRVT